jgi:nucleoside-diphosphate-sugar epimerase
MKALVTGGSGFIGSNVTRLLLEKGSQVRVYDNLSSGHFENIKDFNVEFIQKDILDSEAVRAACQGVDVVFHLAASVGRQRSIDNPQLDSQINLIGTVNVLEGMRLNGVKRIVYSSSAAMFGELLTPEIDESHPQNADSPYGVSKLAAEKMILAYTGIYDIQAVCLRYFNIYGVNQRYDLYGNVIPIFAHKLFAGEPLTIYGDGTQTRDFVNVKDIARANLMAGLSDIPTNYFNMGSGSSITINKLAEMMQEISGIHTGIQYLPKRKADVLHCKANANKVLETMGFKAEVSLEEGLTQYIEWYRNNIAKQ